MGIARDILDTGAYHDVHCWVFTPRSMALLFVELLEHGLIACECVSFHDTAPGSIEFFVGIKPCADTGVAIANWLAMAAAVRPFPRVDSPPAEIEPEPEIVVDARRTTLVDLDRPLARIIFEILQARRRWNL